MVIEQYKHHLYLLHSNPATVDEIGDIVPGNSVWTLHGSCREEVSGGTASYNEMGMKVFGTSPIVQMPAGTAYIQDGADVFVSNSLIDEEDLNEERICELLKDGTIRVRGKVKKFDKGQLHCRIWL